VIRLARPADAEPLGALQVRSWWSVYGAFVDHALIIDAALRVRDGWRRRLIDDAEPESETWVAEHDGAVTGFVTIGPPRDADARDGDGELRAIYIDPPRVGTGDGHALLARGEERLRALGSTASTLWVMSENHGARRFYERHGWAPDALPGENPYTAWGDATRYRKPLREPAAEDPADRPDGGAFGGSNGHQPFNPPNVP
jgi:GNAT superfamily N-acetyltransferase